MTTPCYENGDHDGWGAGASIPDPVWVPGAPSKPVAYTKANAISMEVVLTVDPSPARAIPVHLLGDGPGDLDVDVQLVLSSPSVSASCVTTALLPGCVQKMDAQYWWFVQSTSIRLLGVTTHPLYTLFGAPQNGQKPTAKRLDCALGGQVSGKSTVMGIAEAAYPLRPTTRFAAVGKLGPCNVAPIPDEQVDAWYMFSPDEAGWSVWGACDGVAITHAAILHILGVPAPVVYVYACTSPGTVPRISESPTDYQFRSFGYDEPFVGPYQAFLMYMDAGGFLNKWEGCVKVTDGSTVKFFAGVPSLTDPSALEILRGVAQAEYWIWWDTRESPYPEHSVSYQDDLCWGPSDGGLVPVP